MMGKSELCKICEHLFPSETMHVLYPDTSRKVCTSCFAKELEKSREQWKKDHPCPFKMKIHPEIIDPSRGGYQTDWDHQVDVCKIIHRDTCVGEKNCPIYNGGMK